MFKVMLIEDDRTMLSLLTTLLQLEGFDVITPVNDQPDSILETIRQHHPDVALLDVNLRQCNGLELIQSLRTDDELKNQRVIMSSGLNLEDECLKAGANSFLLKPYMPDVLIDLIKQIIGKENSG
ncbi:MAG TPA: response regulator [Anaerolineales bacterium]|nr:response regulator [Anaerolineales bacterium]